MAIYSSKLDAFFGAEGLTNTSANFIANKAKEMYENSNNVFFDFVTSEVSVIGMDRKVVSHKGMTLDEFNKSIDEVANVGKLKALIAWLREAIKARQTMVDAVKITDVETYAAELGLELPTLGEMMKRITEDDVIAEMSVAERCRYYYLEAQCANLGKLIHPSGDFSNSIKQAKQSLRTGLATSGEGRDMTITEYSASLDMDMVDHKFMEMQELHRSLQAELNGIKHKIEIALDEHNSKVMMSNHRSAEEFNLAMKTITDKVDEARDKELRRIRGLKIIIPDSLKETYELVAAVGKNK
ncbi:MAG: hypothetical protein J6T48_00470 [Bacteroidales bacterium]|nr:hypothetical protein [Bacteroidales bacterium]